MLNIRYSLWKEKLIGPRVKERWKKKKDLENEIVIAEADYKKVLEEFTDLGESLKKLDDELRAVEKRLRVAGESKDKLL